MGRNRASLRKGLQQSSVFDYHVNHGPGLCCRVCMVIKAIVGMPICIDREEVLVYMCMVIAV